MSRFQSIAAALTVAAMGLLAPLAAQAQYDRPIGQPLEQASPAPMSGGAPLGGPVYGSGQGYHDGYAVRCESEDGRHRECRANVQRRLTLVRQLSDAACVEGQTWGSDRNGRVWVRRGCRGDFAPVQGWGQGGGSWDQGSGYTLRCESEDGQRRNCRANVQTRMTLVRQLSDAACVEGRSWGSDDRGRVWVRQGCRGEFGPLHSGGGWGQSNHGRTVTCESVNQRHNACGWDARWGRPHVVEQLSDDACHEGRTWGYDGRRQIWVDRGCRARFAAR